MTAFPDDSHPASERDPEARLDRGLAVAFGTPDPDAATFEELSFAETAAPFGSVLEALGIDVTTGSPSDIVRVLDEWAARSLRDTGREGRVWARLLTIGRAVDEDSRRDPVLETPTS